MDRNVVDKLSSILYLVVCTLVLQLWYLNPLSLLCNWIQDFRFYGRYQIDEEVEDFMMELVYLYIRAEDDITRPIRDSINHDIF